MSVAALRQCRKAATLQKYDIFRRQTKRKNGKNKFSPKMWAFPAVSLFENKKEKKRKMARPLLIYKATAKSR